MYSYNYVTIEGNIGAGKTTLATILAERLQAKLVLEQFSNNPFLPDFYKNPDKNAFPLELFFMAERHQQLREQVVERDLFQNLIISDYFFQKSLLFAKVTLKQHEFDLFQRLFNIVQKELPLPDLIIYLYADIPRLQANIARRGREYEQQIRNDYLARIQETYLNYFRHHPEMRVVLIDVTEVNVPELPHAQEQIISLLQTEVRKGVSVYNLREGGG